MVFENAGILVVYMLQAIGYMVLGLLFVSVLRSNALAIILYLLYFIMIEPVIRGLCPVEFRSWFPVKIISHLTPLPEFLKVTSGDAMAGNAMNFEDMGLMARQLEGPVTIIMALVYISLFSFLTYLVVKKRDL